MKSPYAVVLNDYGGTTVEERTRKSGKKHVTMSIRAELINNDLDPIKLGRGPAEALAEVIRQQIAGINDRASTDTLLKRQYAADAFARGASWATRRYSGGRTGAKPPAQSERLYNDSGRLAGSIVAMANEQERAWTINCAVNRLDPSTFKGGAAGEAFQSMVRGLVDRVPALTKPLEQPAVAEAIVKSFRATEGALEDARRARALDRWRDAVSALQAVERVLR